MRVPRPIATIETEQAACATRASRRGGGDGGE